MSKINYALLKAIQEGRASHPCISSVYFKTSLHVRCDGLRLPIFFITTDGRHHRLLTIDNTLTLQTEQWAMRLTNDWVFAC